MQRQNPSLLNPGSDALPIGRYLAFSQNSTDGVSIMVAPNEMEFGSLVKMHYLGTKLNVPRSASFFYSACPSGWRKVIERTNSN